MAPLTAGRLTDEMADGDRSDKVGAASKIFAGAIVMRNATGFLIRGATATGSFGVGRAEALADNSAGADGAINCTYRRGVFRFANSSAGDLIAQADVGAKCWIVDDQTVAKTNGTNTRSPAGIVEAVDSLGVWVRMDEHLTRAT